VDAFPTGTWDRTDLSDRRPLEVLRAAAEAS